MISKDTDLAFMRHALSLAARGLGRVWPNPAVGAVIVRGSHVVGRGWTGKGGRPHAETTALASAGEAGHNATMYVTLEPCAHIGHTLPCTDGIINAGILRVVAACADPDPRVSGQGFTVLRRAGIGVCEGVCEEEARALNAGFFRRITYGRPFVSLKLATSLDGCMAWPPGHPERWITGEQARAYGHLLRSRYDAILTGIGTALTDDPVLTCRLPGLESRSPVRVILDSELRLPEDSQLARTAKDVPLWVITKQQASEKANRLEELGIKVASLPGTEREIDLQAALEWLAPQGITRLLVEAGPTLTAAFLQAKLADKIYWFRAPTVIGGEKFAAMPASWQRVEHCPLGGDMLEVYAPSPAGAV